MSCVRGRWFSHAESLILGIKDNIIIGSNQQVGSGLNRKRLWGQESWGDPVGLYSVYAVQACLNLYPLHCMCDHDFWAINNFKSMYFSWLQTDIYLRLRGCPWGYWHVHSHLTMASLLDNCNGKETCGKETLLRLSHHWSCQEESRPFIISRTQEQLRNIWIQCSIYWSLVCGILWSSTLRPPSLHKSNR